MSSESPALAGRLFGGRVTGEDPNSTWDVTVVKKRNLLFVWNSRVAGCPVFYQTTLLGVEQEEGRPGEGRLSPSPLQSEKPCCCQFRSGGIRVNVPLKTSV